MFYLNTTRRLLTPPDDAVLGTLVDEIVGGVAPSAGAVPGLRSITWMLSQDRMTMQSFSGWASWDDLPRAEHSAVHVRNSETINRLLGGLARAQEHTYYRVIASSTFESTPP